MLLDPGYIPIQTPKILLGRSAYDPADRKLLLSDAIGFKWGLRSKILRKVKGACKMCGCSLLEETPFEIHHILPIKFGRSNAEINLTALCIDCHYDVSNAVSTKNLKEISKFVTTGILSPTILSTLS